MDLRWPVSLVDRMYWWMDEVSFICTGRNSLRSSHISADLSIVLATSCPLQSTCFLCTWLPLRNRVAGRGTRWISAASRPPSRSCSSTGPRTPRCQSSSRCRPPTPCVRLLPVTPAACSLTLTCRPPTRSPTPPPAPPATLARARSAATTRWRYQNTMMPWCSCSLLIGNRVSCELVGQYLTDLTLTIPH